HDEPHHVLGGQLAPPHRRRAGRGQRVRNPRRIDRRAELLEACRTLTGPHGKNGLPTPIAPPPVGETNCTLWTKRPLPRRSRRPRWGGRSPTPPAVSSRGSWRPASTSATTASRRARASSPTSTSSTG